MRGRILLLGFVSGVGVVHTLAQPPSVWWTALWVIGLLVIGVVLLLLGKRSYGAGAVSRHRNASSFDRWRRTRWRQSISFALIGTAAMGGGVLYTSAWVQYRLADALHPINEDKVSRVIVRIAELPRRDHQSRSFVAEVLSSRPDGVPKRIQVRWNAGKYPGPYGPKPGSRPVEFPELIPGQVWRMALVLRTPYGQRNPNGFDYEGHIFAQGVRAVGTVRGTPILLDDEPWASLPVVAQRTRHYVRDAMLPHIESLRWGGVLLALAIGDQASVASGDWVTFNRSGLTHLVSISGSHVTMIAVIAAMMVNYLWRRVSWRGRALAERLPAQLAAAWVALIVAWLYCLLAGWGVPARRTFIMLAVVALSLAIRLPLAASHVLAIAAFVVVLLDPWALLAGGFWLSFLAVYVLMACTGWWGQPANAGAGATAGSWSKLREAATLQIFVTLALLPPLAMMFSEISIVSPFANAYAIPIIGVLVTPLALLLAGVALVPGWEPLAHLVATIAHWLLDVCMWPTQRLAELPGASLAVAAVPLWVTLFAMLGVVLALLPRGFPYRHFGWAFMLPALVWTPARPDPGDWDLYALDVGQGSALVLITTDHVLVFDTGMRYSAESDAADRALLPFLRSKGVRKIDVLVVSHADLDHIGGLRSALKGMRVAQTYTPFDLETWLAHEGRLLREPDTPPMPEVASPCKYGTGWRTDGIRFDFLWPLGKNSIDIRAGSRERNRQACVLRIQGANHSIILPGDIGVDEERTLVDRGLGHTDLVVAAHHGSRHSSAEEFVAASEAHYVIAQAGRWNRYGHPAEMVRRRWETYGAQFLDTSIDGAIFARSRNAVLTVETERERRPRYWSTPSCVPCADEG